MFCTLSESRCVVVEKVTCGGAVRLSVTEDQGHQLERELTAFETPSGPCWLQCTWGATGPFRRLRTTLTRFSTRMGPYTSLAIERN